MSEEEKDQVLEGEEETPEEISKEPEVEPEPEPKVEATPQQAFDLARAVQKGYTLTRQDMARMRENQDKIQEMLGKMQQDKDGFGEDVDEPLTVKKFLTLQKNQTQAKETASKKIQENIDRQLNGLKAEGLILNKKDEDELMKYAVSHKITNLFKASQRLQEVKQARKEGVKSGLKGKVKGEAGSKVGTSQRTGKKEQGIDYGEIASKSMDELAEE